MALLQGAVPMVAETAVRPGERIFLWLLLAFGIFVLVTALMIPRLENLSSSGVFPIFIASILIVAVIRILWANRTRYGGMTLRAEWLRIPAFVLPMTVIGYALILCLYILTTASLHFIPSSFGFLVISFIFLRGASPVRALVIGAGTLAAIYLLFQTIFKVILW